MPVKHYNGLHNSAAEVDSNEPLCYTVSNARHAIALDLNWLCVKYRLNMPASHEIGERNLKMKRICSLLLLIMFVLSCNAMSIAETVQTADTAHIASVPEKDLSMFPLYTYDELSMDEIPDGELTEELLNRLEEEHADRIFDTLLPWLVEKGYVQELPRSAYLNYVGTLWIEDIGSFADLWMQNDSVPIEEMPTSLIHLSPECDLTATRRCNYFAIYFWNLESLFDLCPKCYPVGWIYDYLFSFEFEGVNQLQIDLRTEAIPGKYDQPRSVIAYFNHETDECPSIAVQYEGQDYVIVYQNDHFKFNGIISCCQNCEDPWSGNNAWATLEDGLWHCKACGTITKVEGE